jgi:16S rRNA (guanine527-N7)-methyltransferase
VKAGVRRSPRSIGLTSIPGRVSDEPQVAAQEGLNPPPAQQALEPGGDAGQDAGLRARLEAGLQALAIAATPQQREHLLAYLALIARWNRVYNLTAVREPQAMLTQHLLDSLAVWPPLQRVEAGRGQGPGPGLRVLDVGSGAGLPGVVLAIMGPDLRVTCVDAVGKKAGFVRQVAAELGLSNLQALHARVEQLPVATGYDVITSRAFASLADFVQISQPVLAPGGVWMAMKGQQPDDELAGLPPGIEMFHVEPLQVPGLDARRCLVWMRRSG